MKFSEFVQLLYPILADGRSVELFTKDLLLGIVNIPNGDGIDKNPIFDLTYPALKSYYYGTNRLSRLAPQINGYIDRVQFEGFFEDASDDAIEQLCKIMKQHCDDVDQWSVKEKIALLFQDVLLEEAVSNKRTRTKAKNDSPYNPKLIEGKSFCIQALQEKSREEFSRLQRLLKYKIEPNLVSKVDCDITEYNHILLVGDGGAGKTSFLLKHWEDLLAKKQLLPLYVPLNRFKGNDKRFIRDYIQDQYFKMTDIDFEECVRDAENCDVVLLLDAINEAKNLSELGEEIEVLCSLDCKIILTSRHEMDGWDCLSEFKRTYLLPLSDEVVNELLQMHKLQVSDRMRPLLTKPMYLALFLKLGDEAKRVESPGELFLAHHKWIQRSFSVDKHGLVYHEIGDTAFETVLPQIADTIETVRFTGKDVKAIIDSHFADEGWDYREVLNLFVDAGILTKERKIYLFTHEYYLDFYRAYNIYREMQKFVPKALGTSLLSHTIASFLGDLWQEYRFEKKADCCSQMSPLENWMQQHLKNKIDVATKKTVQNLFACMKIARHNNITGDYSGIDLTECCFYGDNIQNSIFNRARVSTSCFFALQGHKSPPNEVAYASSRNVVVSVARFEHKVFLWHATNGKLLQEINCHASIRHVAISPDEEWLAICLHDGDFSVYIYQMSKLPNIQSPHTRIKLYADLDGGASNYTFTEFDDNGNDIPDYEYAYPCVVSFCSDSQSIVCGTAWGLLHRHDVVSGKRCIPAFKLLRNGYSVYYGVSLENNVIITSSGNDNYINVRDIYTFESIGDIKKDSIGIKYTAFSNPVSYSDSLIAIAENQDVVVVDTLSNEKTVLSLPLKFKRTFIDNLALSNSKVWGMAGLGNIMRECFIVDIASNTTTILPIRNPVCITVVANANRLIVVDETCKLYLIDISRGTIEQTLNIGHLDRPNPLNFDPIFPAQITLEDSVLRRTNQGEFIVNSIDKPSYIRLAPQPVFITLPPDVVKRGDFWFDGSFLIAVEQWEMIRIWDANSGRQVLSFSGNYRDVVKVSYVEKLQKVYVELDDRIEIVSVAKLDEIYKDSIILSDLKQADEGHIRRFYNGVKHIGNDEDWRITDVECQCVVSAFLPEYGILVFGYNNGILKTQNIFDAEESFTESISSHAIKEIHSLTDKPYIVAKDEAGNLILWDVIKKECLDRWSKEEYPIGWFQVNKTLYIDYVLADEIVGRGCNSIELPAENLLKIQSPQGSLIALQTRGERLDDEIRVSMNGSAFVARNANRALVVYDTISGSILHEEPCRFDRRYSDSVCGWEISPSGQKLIVTYCDGTVRIVDVNTKEICEIPVCVTNVIGCDLSNAYFDNQNTKNILAFNGAVC